MVNSIILAEFKKFNIRSDAQDYFDNRIKIKKSFAKKYSSSKSKILNSIPTNLVKNTIEEFSTKQIVSSCKTSSVRDTNDDQGKPEGQYFMYLSLFTD